MKLVLVTAFVGLASVSAASESEVKGSFVLGGAAAKLSHVRAVRVVLDDKGAVGYAVLLSARVATGSLDSWRTADPAERGSFIHVILDVKGDVWVAELGHAARKSGRFGVVTELVRRRFELKGERLSARLATARDEDFLGDRYAVDVEFTAQLEGAAK